MGQSVHPKGFRLIKLKNWENRECVVEKERYLESLNFQRSLDEYIENFFIWVFYKKILKSIRRRKKKRCLLVKKSYKRSKRREIEKIFLQKLQRIKNEKKRMNILRRVRRGAKFILWEKKKKRRKKYWRRKCQFKKPVFLYSHTVFLRRNGKLELNVVLYVRVKGRITGYKRIYQEKKWKEVIHRLLEARLYHNFFKERFQLKIHYLKGPWLNASLCARYIIFMLKRRKKSFGSATQKLLYKPEYYGGEKHNIYGVFVAGAGRFTKRQRASYRKNQRGRVPYSTISVPVEYVDMSVPLKYGACSIKVWLCHLRK